MTEWRDIPKWPGYQASDEGQVRSVDRLVTCANGQVRRYRGRQLKITRTGRDGRPGVMMCDATTKTQAKCQVGVLVLEAFVGPRPSPDHEACHDDGDPWHNAPGNLRWDTRASNADDRVRHGKDHHAVRERCPCRHLLKRPNLVEAQLRRNGTRACRACSQARAAIFYAVKMGRAAPDLQALADEKYRSIMLTASTV